MFGLKPDIKVISSFHTFFTGRILLVLALGYLAGWLVDQPYLGLFLSTLTYLIWSQIQLQRLLSWIEKSERKEIDPPESTGIWGEIFDGIYRIQRKHNRARKRLRNVIERIQESTAALNDGVVMADQQGCLEWWNPAAEELLGLKMPDDQGQLITNLMRDPEFGQYLENSTHRDPIEVVAPQDDSRQLQIDITIYGEGNRLLLIRDMTRLHQLENMRKDFVANVSHEMRTPLTVISGYLETLLDGAEGVPPVWHKVLTRMQEQSLRMQNLVSDLLLLSKLEVTDAEEKNRRVKIKPLLETIVEDARALSAGAEHQISLQCDDDSLIIGDSKELRSAFSNLTFNAVRYTPMGGKIKLKWWQDEQGGHLQIKDNGVGIDPVHIPRLTERFYRVDKSRSHSTGGTGLGLAIVKHVLLRHDGYISISSLPGKGSRFVCHFPEKRLVNSTVVA